MLNRLVLHNWKSHKDTEYEFSPGVNIIAGKMGAGKSSIFQAITFALFGSLPEIKSRDVKTTELVNRNPTAEETQIKLLFSRGRELAITRAISKKAGTGNATVRDEQNQLTAGPKPTAATAFVNELLKTDLDTFLRTVYAKQNEIDLFLKYSPADRKKYIDELMKLDKFELARKHSTQLQNKTKTRLDENKKLLETTDPNKLASDIKNLISDLCKLEKKKIEVAQDIKIKSEKEHAALRKLTELREKKSHVDGLNQNLLLLTHQIDQLKIKLKDVRLELSRQELNSRIQTLQAKLQTLTARERQLAVLASREKDLKTRQDDVERLRSESHEIATLRPTLLTDIETLNIKKDGLSDKLANANAEFNSIIEHLDKLKRAESICPVCTTKLTPELKKQLIDKQKAQIIKLTKDKNNANSELNTIKKELEDLDALARKKSGLDERIAEVQKVCDEIASELTEKSAAEKINEIEIKIKNIRDKINSLTEQKSLCDAKDQLDNLEKKRSDVQANLAELSFDPKELLNVETEHFARLRRTEELAAEQRNIAALTSEKTLRKNELLEQQAKLAKLSETIAGLSGKIEFLSTFNNALLTTQEVLRIDLISTVNEVMSNIWVDIYPYEKWIDIRLQASEADYSLQICDENNDYFSVAGFASGGERMLAALAMRIAFAKVLAPHLSLLILDEPTHNLDQTAIDTFLDVLHNKLANYLDQIFIITHDPKLAEAGNLIEV